MPFSFLVRPRPDQVRAARLDADTADRVAAVMRESNARLEERVRQLQSRVSELERENQSLRTRADADSQAHLLKSRFLQHAETELRASFEAVVGFARLLWEEASLGQRPMLGSLLSGSQRMGKVIDQMAAVSPLDAVGLAFEEVEAADLVGGASRAVAMEMARRGVALEAAAPTPVKVRADAAWIRHALTVFVLRAIDRGSSVAMSAIPKGSLVRFDVADRGPDIDAAALDMLLVEPEIARCRRVIELHGGALEVTSGPRLGCTIAFTLPAVTST